MIFGAKIRLIIEISAHYIYTVYLNNVYIKLFHIYQIITAMSKTKKTDKKNEPKTEPPHKTGLDEWNDRLDQNFENEHEGNELADEKARDYSYRAGSGDQSDETIDIQK